MISPHNLAKSTDGTCVSYLENRSEPTPTWLNDFSRESQFVATEFFNSRIVYYPGSGFDGQPVEMFGSTHSAHCFVYADYGVQQDAIRNQLNDPRHGFRGYETFCRIELTERDLVPNGWKAHITAGERRQANTCRAPIKDQPYGLVEILTRKAGFDETHGAKKLAILFLGADGVATYDALFCQQTARPPFAIVLPNQGFGGNYTAFGRDGLLAKIAERTKTFPELLLCADNTTPWTSYTQIPDVEPARGGMHSHCRQLFSRKEKSNSATVYEICGNLKKREGVLNAAEAKSQIDVALSIATDCLEYHEIACAIARCPSLKDKTWASRIFEHALKMAESVQDMIRCGYDIARSDGLGDKEWARKVFAEAESKIDADDFEALSYLAMTIMESEVLADKEWGKSIIEEALARETITSHDIIAIAKTVADDELLADKEWASRLIEKASTNVEYSNDYVEIACCVAGRSFLNRKEDGRHRFETAVRAMSQYTPADYFDIAKLVADPQFLNDKKWAVELCVATCRAADDIGYLLEMALFLASLDQEQSDRVFRMSLEKAKTPRDLLAIACYVAAPQGLDHPDRADEFFDRACDGADDEEIALVELNRTRFFRKH